MRLRSLDLIARDGSVYLRFTSSRKVQDRTSLAYLTAEVGMDHAVHDDRENEARLRATMTRREDVIGRQS